MVIFIEQNRLAVLLEKDGSVEAFRIKGEVLYDFMDRSEAIKTVASYIQSSMQLQSFDSIEVYMFSQEKDEEFHKVVCDAFGGSIVHILAYGVIDQFVELAVTKDLLEAEKINAEYSDIIKKLKSENIELKVSTQDLDQQLGNSSKLIKKLTEKNKKLQDFYNDKTKTVREIIVAKVKDEWIRINFAKKSGDFIKVGEEFGTYDESKSNPIYHINSIFLREFNRSLLINTIKSGYIYLLWISENWFEQKDYVYKNKEGSLALVVISSKKDDTMEDIEEFVKQRLS